MKLAQLRESGEISPDNFDIETLIQLAEYGLPLTRKEVGNHAVVLTPDDILNLHTLTFIAANGSEIDLEHIDLNSPILILFPDDLGDKA